MEFDLTHMMKTGGVNQMEAAILIPVNGAKVRDPITMNYLAEEGELKPLTGPQGRYWRRRINDHSVMVKPVVKIKRSAKAGEF